ncbi:MULTISPECIES: T9SS type B sorting domain-containing protein [Flavobacterium]|uniref:T9SS type B sorting domain-containing protein n=1 Tax=Flavobacterium TaxID=237 RepID=UPI001FCB8E2C|nr:MULTISPECIES: T9SS type B sorting domain-containing protein [Flavobacterium]UOK41162.1 T9SS type B sorting domain-containing protein [Flavobacterium enshiense]
MEKFLIYILILLYTSNTYSQCFDCNKNYGGWTDDHISDIKQTNDGVSILVGGGSYYPRIIKHDFNCNVLSQKIFTSNNLTLKKHVYDNSGNTYLLIHYGSLLTTTSPGPFYENGIVYYRGLNLLKFDAGGNFIWIKHVGDNIGRTLADVYYSKNQIYVVGTFYQNISINGQISFNFPYTDHPRAFVAKFLENGNLIAANYFGNGYDDFTNSAMDSNENIYLARYNRTNFIAHSDIDKINNNLQRVWTKEISNSNNANSIYIPTHLFYSTLNNKLYLWGAFNSRVNVLGNIFNSSVFQSLLSEFNSDNGALLRIKRFDNNSGAAIPSVLGSSSGNNAYIAEKNNELYILSSFRSTMNFPNSSVTSTTRAEDLILFKIDLANFEPEYLLKSYGVQNLNHNVNNFAGPILFKNDDLYITSIFQSKPISLNNSTINNNSGNNNSDVLFYKYNTDENLNNEILVTNTCLNNSTEFEMTGTFDNITWNFGDNSSNNNTSTSNTASHLFSSPGNYHISATITCGTSNITIAKDIVISPLPVAFPVPTQNKCESISGSGISTDFNTSNFQSVIIGNQQNVIVNYYSSDGNPLPNPLPNPYTNQNIGGDSILAKVFYPSNPNCYAETTIQLNVSTKPTIPITTNNPVFCLEQNATLNNITITGQNIKWYDAPTGGNLLASITPLQNGVTYYASQTVNSCESARVPVTVTIQNTQAPTGNIAQSFCSSQNATLNDITVSGSNLIWYNSATGTNVLPGTTLLASNTTYYATQTVNGCESLTRLAVTVILINTLSANNYAETLCDDLNNGSETVNLSNYNSDLIATTNGNTFTYYHSQNGAENQINSEAITNFANYNLSVGNNVIFVRIDSNNGCHQVVELNLTLVSKPVIPITDIMPICEGSSITVNAGNGFDSYLWSTAETTPSITISNPGNYSVSVSENHGSLTCTSVKNFTVVNSNAATIAEIITSDWTNNQNTITVLLTGNSAGDYVYSLDGTHYQSSNTFTGLQSGEYIVYVKDKNGCGIKSEDFYLLMYPKFFTPNGDGYNDYWKIVLSEKEPNMKIMIFDRFGKLMKELGADSQGWDGTFSGSPVPSSDYWFVVERQNGKEYRGHFSLKR